VSRFDLVASLLRSSARGAATKLRELPGANALSRLLSDAALGRTVIPSAQLTAAVARALDASAATVTAGDDATLHVDVALADGTHLATRLRLTGAVFAAGGAKELSFEADPPESAKTPSCRDAVAAIAAELARALWKPVLLPAPESGPADFVALDDGRLVVDLRSVPEVRWALRQRLPAAMIELLRPRSVSITPQGLELQLSLDPLASTRR
jgi:hypothetical protein